MVVAAQSFIIAAILSAFCLLCSLLLLLLVLARVLGQWLLEYLQHLLICDLLVRLVLGYIQSRGRSQACQAVLSDGCEQVSKDLENT